MVSGVVEANEPKPHPSDSQSGRRSIFSAMLQVRRMRLRTGTPPSPRLIGHPNSKASHVSSTRRKPAPVHRSVDKLLYDRKSAGFALSISVRAVDYALARGEFETLRIGRKTLITARSLKRYSGCNHFGPVNAAEPIRNAA